MVKDLRLSQRGQSWEIIVWERSIQGETEILLSVGDHELDEMTTWVKANRGRRTAWNYYEFETKNDALLFIMRWG